MSPAVVRVQARVGQTQAAAVSVSVTVQPSPDREAPKKAPARSWLPARNSEQPRTSQPLNYSNFERSSTANRLRRTVRWCPGEDSNLHGVTHWYLKPARLPIPPPGPGALFRRAGGIVNRPTEFRTSETGMSAAERGEIRGRGPIAKALVGHVVVAAVGGRPGCGAGWAPVPRRPGSFGDPASHATCLASVQTRTWRSGPGRRRQEASGRVASVPASRRTPACPMRVQAAASDASRSIARQASSITKVSKPAAAASMAEKVTQ